MLRLARNRRNRPCRREGRELGGATLGIFGYGAIGRGIAQLARAFGCRVLVATRTVSEGETDVTFTDLDELMAESDVVVVAAGLTPQTRGIVGAGRIGLMKPSALLVNIARGAIVDEAALAEAVTEGRVTAALDAFATEPLPADSPFRTLPGAVCTPHTAGSSQQSRQRIWEVVTRNFARLAAGETPHHIVN